MTSPLLILVISRGSTLKVMSWIFCKQLFLCLYLLLTELPELSVIDEVFSTWMTFGENARDLGSLEKKRTRLRTYTKSLKESCSQNMETASQA
ncbi:hypothetical protein Tco_1477049 [Tanacetum coccineum]